MLLGIPCMIMRGGTSKGLYLLEKDLPPQGADRDAVLLRLMGSPDIRQIDGLGGATSVTSKVAIVSPSQRDDADVDYTFAQVSIRRPMVSYAGNCGNISSGVGPFAIESGLVEPMEGRTEVRIQAGEMDIQGRMMSMQKAHQTYALTGAMCTAAAAAIPGTLVWEAMPCDGPGNVSGSSSDSGLSDGSGGEAAVGTTRTSLIRIAHPGGIMEAGAVLEEKGTGNAPKILRVYGVRTARLLMKGVAYI